MNRVPLFFREEHAGFIVKGNFMTLAAKPHLIEQGEWMAHQSDSTGFHIALGSADRASPSTTYTWIDTNRNPINLPAPTYIKHIQTWVTGKIQDYSIFPTDTFSSAPPLLSPAQLQADPNNWLGKTSGFPQRFETECKNMYKQMFRCYAHLYWQHWLFFWDTSCHRELNTCFMHFASVGIIYGLLSEKDAEPMQPLIDLWVKQGVMPKIEKVEAGNGVMTPTSAGGAGSVGGTGSGGAAGSPGVAGGSVSTGGAGLENGNGAMTVPFADFMALGVRENERLERVKSARATSTPSTAAASPSTDNTGTFGRRFSKRHAVEARFNEERRDKGKQVRSSGRVLPGIAELEGDWVQGISERSAAETCVETARKAMRPGMETRVGADKGEGMAIVKWDPSLSPLENVTDRTRMHLLGTSDEREIEKVSVSLPFAF
ncbi:hypothetical protein B0A54_14477 [Friedmanniomyces endolithicus]|uniref:Mob1/phocein n=1 Tax=Friedmanniomyces endolithicus TaxID=329885 RepID=A0A4U0UCR4_9PEZI|nr:hypothetical protein B0A54_14477 [Friedmanniomyces endolithicus]